MKTAEPKSKLSLYKKIYKEKHIFYFLIGMMLVSDAILTFQIYVTVFLKKVYLMDDKMAVYAGIIGLFFCLVGGIISPWVVRKSKNTFHALIMATFLYSICF